MAYQMNAVRAKATSISVERLIKALGIDEARRLLNTVDEKAPARARYISSDPLSKEEKAQLIECVKSDNWNAIAKIFKLDKASGRIKFAIMAHRYLSSITIK